MKRTGPDDVLRCSFCHKSQGVVGKLIASPSEHERAYICDECIAVCNAILEDDKPKPQSPIQEEIARLRQHRAELEAVTREIWCEMDALIDRLENLRALTAGS